MPSLVLYYTIVSNVPVQMGASGPFEIVNLLITSFSLLSHADNSVGVSLERVCYSGLTASLQHSSLSRSSLSPMVVFLASPTSVPSLSLAVMRKSNDRIHLLAGPKSKNITPLVSVSSLKSAQVAFTTSPD